MPRRSGFLEWAPPTNRFMGRASPPATAPVVHTAAANDSISFSDSAVVLGQVEALAADTIVFGDSAIGGIVMEAAANDSIVFSDEAEGQAIALYGAGEDTISFSDEAVATTNRVAVASDSLSLSDSAVSVSQRVAAATDTIAFSDSGVASLGGADPLLWYPSYDKSQIPFHVAGGDYGTQYVIQEAAEPTLTTTGTVSNAAQLADALYTGGVEITPTDDIGPWVFNDFDIADCRVIVPPGALWEAPTIGAFDGSVTVERLLISGESLSHGSGGQLHEFKAFAPFVDAVITGLDLSGPGGNAGCVSLERVSSSRLMNRIAVVNCRAKSGGWFYYGTAGDLLFANLSILTGADLVNVAEAWGFRVDFGFDGACLMIDVDCRSDPARSGFAYPRIRHCPKSPGARYAWHDGLTLVERVESSLVWQSSQSGNSGVDGGNLDASWFRNILAIATGGTALFSMRDCVYARAENIEFQSDTFTTESQIITNDASPLETGPSDVLKSGITFSSLPGSDPAWGGPGDPSGINWNI